MLETGQGKFYNSLEAMSLQDRERYITEKAQWVARYAYRKAEAVRKKLDRAGIDPREIETIKDFQRIPVTTRDEIIQMQKASPIFGGFLAVPQDRVNRVFVSPGPLYEPQGGLELFQGTQRGFRAAGFGKGDIVLNTFSYHLAPAGSGFEEALRSLGCTVIPSGVGNTELQVSIMRDLKVTGFVGTAGFLMTMVKKAEEMGFRFKKDLALRKAVVGGEMLSASLRAALEKDYGINLTQIYGISVAMLGYECEQKSGMHIPEEVLVEIVDPSTGKQLGPEETGEVVVTLLNKIYPLLRFATGDISSYSDEICPCGRTSPRLGRILGRIGDGIKVRGLFLLTREVEAVLSKFPEASCFQVFITRSGGKDEISLKLELAKEPNDKRALAENIGAGFKDVCQLKVDRVEFLATGTLPEGHKKMVDQRSLD